MAELAIEARGLTKRFGSHNAINNVTLHVPRGSCVGFLGPNGAGKTTMMRMVLGLARPTSGSVRVRGYDVRTNLRDALRGVSGIVEEPRFYPYLSARDNLKVFAGLLGGAAHRRIDSVLETAGLHGRGDDAVKVFSLGMRTRLGLARALLNDPELLVLDEPTNGLDAAGMADFREFARSTVAEGRTILISSHLLDEMQKIVDYVAIVNRGTVVMEGPLQQLIEGGQHGIDIECDNVGLAVQTLEAMPHVESVREIAGQGIYAEVTAAREVAATINRALVEAGVAVWRLNPREETLEQRYFDITKYSEQPKEDGRT